ncbi:MAG: exodeoxyribonuclease VII large subunit [Ignavibacteriaceae bacterium]
MNELLSVSELTKKIKVTIEEKFTHVNVVGEISGYKAHNSGHWYFNLKDSDAVICCTMWRSFNSNVFFTPRDGMKVVISGKVTVYPPRGNYQVDVRSMRPAGVGELQAAFEMLKQKLAVEGLFDESSKKSIPVFSEKIGIVTAIDGAAFRDMISIAKRRFPLVELIIASARVQGIGAAESVVDCIQQLNKREDIGVIIVARGGGSIEDLWAFNEEIVARAIFNSRIPVITGIGHEIDFTIADFVADLRAPTPSAAMEIVTPNKEDVFAFINDFSYNSTKRISQFCGITLKRIENVLCSYGFRQPIDFVRRYYQQVDNISYKLNKNLDHKFLVLNNSLSLLTKSIESHNIQKTLKKGFVLVKQSGNDKFITRAAKFDNNKETQLKFYDGEVKLK